MRTKYTERDSKFGFLTRRLLKIFCLERVTIAFGKARVKTKILMQSRRGQKQNFDSRSVYIALGIYLTSLMTFDLQGGGCDYCCSNFTLSEPPYAEPKSKKEVAVLKAQGGVAYEEYGDAWHPIRYRTEFTAAQWKTILLQKRIRVPLTAEDQRALSQLFVGE